MLGPDCIATNLLVNCVVVALLLSPLMCALCDADNFAHALQWQQQMDADFEGATMIVANLIHLKYVKGYISQAHRKLVLNRKGSNVIGMAFPPLDTVDVSKIGI